MSYRFRDGVVLKVVSVYRSQENMGPYTVYQHHLQQYNIKNISRDPITVFDEDLSSMLGDWVENGDNVRVLIDANDPLIKSSSGYFQHMMEMIGLQELILNQHTRLQPPPT